MFWANDPATTTPISADNLSRLEKYTLATAGSNGDFYVNFPNGANVATNDIVFIVFPAATNGASNARLSVDNGASYKPIYNVVAQKASDVQNRKLELVYDGTNFVNIDEETPTYLQLIGSSGNQALSGSWAAFKKWNTSSGTGVTKGVMAIDVTNGTITCNFVGYVEISASMLFNGFATGDLCAVKVTVGGSDVFTTYGALPAATYYMNTIPCFIVPVTYGQVIQLEVINGTAARGNASYNGSTATIGNLLKVKRI